MSNSDLKRRDFTKLAMAAMSGMVAGAGTNSLEAQEKKNEGELTMDPALLAKEPHVCRGLNTCQGKGKGENECAGKGACASVKEHACNSMNDCKGQGGCGGYPGQNTCQGKGHCAVPLKKEVWKLARKQFEEVMEDKGIQVGEPSKR